MQAHKVQKERNLRKCKHAKSRLSVNPTMSRPPNRHANNKLHNHPIEQNYDQTKVTDHDKGRPDRNVLEQKCGRSAGGWPGWVLVEQGLVEGIVSRSTMHQPSCIHECLLASRPLQVYSSILADRFNRP